MRKACLVLLFQFIFIIAFSQQSINFGLIYGQRLNYTSNSSSLIGFSTEYLRNLFGAIDIRFSAGIETTQPYIERDGTFLHYDNFMVVPLRLGLQHFPIEEKTFVFAESGASIGFFPFDWTGETGTEVRLSYAIGGGYRFELNEQKYLQVSLSYNRNPYNKLYKFSWIALRAAFGLKWGSKN